MPLIDKIRNIIYAATHAEQLIARLNELDEQVEINQEIEENEVEIEFTEVGQLDGISLQHRIEQYCNYEGEIDTLDVAQEFSYNHGIYRYEAEEIADGIESGLSAEQVTLYAKPYFNWHQMIEIRKGFLQGLSFEQVSAYAKAEYGWKETERIREESIADYKGLSAEEEKEWNLSPKSTQASNLPDGWQWVDYGDGSGHLQDPNGNRYFDYDRQSYSFSGGIEYRVSSDHHYTAFWGTMEDFKNHAESYMKNQYISPLDRQEADRCEPEIEASADNDYEPEM